MNRQRINAFKSAMLNTVVRAIKGAFDNLTLTNCMESEEFRQYAAIALDSPLMSQPIEPDMLQAHLELTIELHPSYPPF